MMDLEQQWARLSEDGYFTENELLLVTCINGYTVETINDMIYARYGYRDIDQLLNDR